MKLPRLPWLWIRSKPSSRIMVRSSRSTARRSRLARMRMSMPISRAVSVKSASMKQTSFTVMWLPRAFSRPSTWVFAPPTSPPLMRVRIFMPVSLLPACRKPENRV